MAREKDKLEDLSKSNDCVTNFSKWVIIISNFMKMLSSLRIILTYNFDIGYIEYRVTT